ncbi:MAG: hypothetical protein P9M09_03520 [Candidatus Celaenobacter antarcticus]|nr:hypothetical protein [Candidatus Celaenobacter antarcticus]
MDSKYCDIIIDNFKFYRNNKKLKIFFYVIMDHHIHVILSHPSGIEMIVQNIKGFIAKEVIALLKEGKKNEILDLLKIFKKPYKKNSTYQFWQEGSHPKLINSMNMLNQKINYIHLNPVKRGFVTEPEDWYYSSARNFAGENNPFKVDELEL